MSQLICYSPKKQHHWLSVALSSAVALFCFTLSTPNCHTGRLLSLSSRLLCFICSSFLNKFSVKFFWLSSELFLTWERSTPTRRFAASAKAGSLWLTLHLNNLEKNVFVCALSSMCGVGGVCLWICVWWPCSPFVSLYHWRLAVVMSTPEDVCVCRFHYVNQSAAFTPL